MKQDREPIAIVGIGCRFPHASGPSEFWRLLSEGRDIIEEIPRDRFDVDALYDATPAQPGKISTRWGGFLGDIDRFDARFFGISAREADRLDPQQRLLLEVAWEAFEDGGLPAESLMGKSGGVFIGMWLNDYEARLFRDPSKIDFYMTTGSGRYSASGRLSYVFGLQGPSLTLDCACSSSLVAVHLACRSIWSGETEFAIAGGANVILEPSITIAYSQSQMMAPDGRCKFGDSRANGYVRSEGAAIVVLKPLAQAVANRDRIYAAIIGSAVNNDGRSSGFLATPGREGQEDMLRKAYRDAGIIPGDVQYVEAHGTGTRAGDPVEIQALGAVLSEGRQPGDVCRIGSVKTNVGHTEGAAGVAGLIKVALSLRHGFLPPSLHVEAPNADIPWQALPVRIQRELEPWPTGPRRRIGGVSSFGIAGTNAHVVLAEVQPDEHAGTAGVESSGPRLIPLSAQSPAALKALADAYARVARGRDDVRLSDLAYTAAVRRSHLDERLAVIAATREELAARLDAWGRDESQAGTVGGRRDAEQTRKVVFVFPGQGSQWLGMARELIRTEPAFRGALEECDRGVRAVTGWSVIDELNAAENTSRLDRIDVIQPVLFAVQVALAALWRSWGVEPDAVVGHSMGEVAAACVASVLSTDDAARVICERSRLMGRTSGRGAMALIGLSMADTRLALAGRESDLSVAVSNSPRSTVVSGDPAAVDALLAELEGRDVFCRRVKVDVASHSPQMDPLREELVHAVRDIAPRSGSVPLYSTVTASRLDGTELDPQYWSKNLRHPVMFSAAVRQLIADGHEIFIEMSPHPLLAPPLQELLQEAGRRGAVLASTRREEPEQAAMLASLGALYALGHPVSWTGVYPSGMPVELPTYPWERQRHWVENVKQRGAMGHATGGHPLLGARLDTAIPIYEAAISATTLRDVGALSVAGSTLLGPGALIEIAMAAAGAVGGVTTLADMSIHAAIPATEAEPGQPVQTVILDGADGATFRVLALTALEPTPEWTLLASGRLEAERVSQAPRTLSIEDLRSHVDEIVPTERARELLAARGIDPDERCGCILEVRRSNSELLARVDFTRLIAGDRTECRIHPLVIDLSWLALSLLDESGPFLLVPNHVTSVARFMETPAQGWVYATVRREGSDPTADVTIRDNAGRVALALTGVALKAVRAEAYAHAHRAATANWHFEIVWEDAERALPEATSGQDSAEFAGAWVVFADGAGVANRLRDALAARGARVIEVRPGQGFDVSGGDRYTVGPLESADYLRVAEHLRSRGVRTSGLIYLWGLDEPAQPRDAVARSAAWCTAAILAQQAFRVAAADSPVRLWIITRGAESCDRSSSLRVAAAPLWGLGRVIALEQPEAWGGLVDLDPAGDPAEIETLIDHLHAPHVERQAALRGGRLRVPRLVRAPAPAGASVQIRPDATYLVTGGLGRLGVRIAHWLAQSGARHIVLTSRRGLPDRIGRNSVVPGSDAASHPPSIQEIEAFGAKVTVVAADVADRAAMDTIVARCGAEWPRLRGIVHAAGVIDHRSIDRLTAKDFATVFRAKVDGAWTLHEATLGVPLDFFAMFSSASAAWGSRELGHYAAANHFLDALSHVRRAQGLTSTSINWGWWAGGGTTSTAEEFFAQIGLSVMPAEPALGVLGDLLGSGVTQRVVAAVDWSRLKPVFEATGSRFLDRIEAAPPRSGSGARRRGELRRATDGRAAEEMSQIVCDYVRSQVADVLGREPEQADATRGFFKMGMDSLMTVELRRRLESALDDALPATIAFEYPTIAALSAFICRSVLKAPDGVAHITEVAAGETTELEASLAERSVDEIAALLDGELDQILGDQGRAN